MCAEIRSKVEETLGEACSLVHSLEITQEPYLTHSSRAAFPESPGLLVTLLEEVAGPSPVGLVPSWPQHGADIYLLPTGRCVSTQDLVYCSFFFFFL